MSAVAPPIPTWSGVLMRALIYAGVVAVAFWWHPVLGLGVGLFIAVDLIHHAADTARRRSGYVPIPRHPSMPGAPRQKLALKGRPLGLIFLLVWALAALLGRAVLGGSWGEVMVQSLALAGFAVIAAAVMFPLAAIALLWVLGVTLGFVLSLFDLAAVFLTAGDRRKAWHRRVDQYDHQLADIILGQQASIPLRADLAERAAEQAQSKGTA